MREGHSNIQKQCAIHFTNFARNYVFEVYYVLLLPSCLQKQTHYTVRFRLILPRINLSFERWDKINVLGCKYSINQFLRGLIVEAVCYVIT